MERETGYEVERELAAGGTVRIVGVDEVGRGSWAGPVMVGVVVVRPPGRCPAGWRRTRRPDVVLLDAKHDYIGRPWTVRTLIKADLHSVSVAAASVIAKVCRDRLMDEIGEDYPDFAFAASPAADRERQARQVDGLSGGRGSARIQHADVFAVRLFSDTLKASLPLLSDLLPPAVAVPPRR